LKGREQLKKEEVSEKKTPLQDQTPPQQTQQSFKHPTGKRRKKKGKKALLNWQDKLHQ